ncbi:MAG: hypothetical protein WA160_04030 [Pseudobdellovibrio sp.]
MIKNKLVFFTLALLICKQLQAQEITGFIPMPANAVDDCAISATDLPKNKQVIENMPSIESQDSFGFCAAYSATAMMNFHQCRLTNMICNPAESEIKKEVAKLKECREKETNCKADGKRPMVPETRISSLDMTRFARDPNEISDSDEKKRPLPVDGNDDNQSKRKDRFSYTGVWSTGISSNIMKNAIAAVSLGTDECSNLSSALAKIGSIDQNSNEDAEAENIQMLRDIYDDYHNRVEKQAGFFDKSSYISQSKGTAINKNLIKSTTKEIEFLKSNTNKINSCFSNKKDSILFLNALRQDHISKFFDEILIPEQCRNRFRPVLDSLGKPMLKADGKKIIQKQEVDFEGSDTMEVKSFPLVAANYEKDEMGRNIYKKIPNAEYGTVIKNVLKKGYPININICLAPENNPDCLYPSPAQVKGGAVSWPNKKPPIGLSHEVVIVGLKKMRVNNVCKEYIKIHNSWGQGWQNSNSDGWVDADKIISRIRNKPGSLVWLDDIAK